MARIPLEPIETAPWEAIPYPLGESPAPANKAALLAALQPLELGAYDRQVVDWLSGEASPIVAAVCSWLRRIAALSEEVER